MNETAIALLGYIGWFMAMLVSLGGYRTFLTISGQKKASSFIATGEGVSAFSVRLCRAHANAYEYFPIAGGLFLYALLSDQTAITDGLALVFLAARVLQSSVHILSTSERAVKIRFFFFLAQTLIALFWLVEFVKQAI